MAVQPEIRMRLDRQEREQFERVGERIGMSANDMVKVFVRRTIAEGGLPFDMKALADDSQRAGERFMPVFGQPATLLAEVATEAARRAAAAHIRAGRLSASADVDEPRETQARRR